MSSAASSTKPAFGLSTSNQRRTGGNRSFDTSSEDEPTSPLDNDDDQPSDKAGSDYDDDDDEPAPLNALPPGLETMDGLHPGPSTGPADDQSKVPQRTAQ